MRISKIKPNDVINGEGVSVSVWTQGCPHHCKGCFNQVTWDFNGGKEFTEEDFEYVMECLDKNNVERNLSILGGEPLCEQNICGVYGLTARAKERNHNRKIYVWTGYLFEDLIEEYGHDMFSHIDYIIDGQFMQDKKDLNLKLRGSSNQRVIDVKATFSKGEIILLDV